METLLWSSLRNFGDTIRLCACSGEMYPCETDERMCDELKTGQVQAAAGQMQTQCTFIWCLVPASYACTISL